MKKELQNMIAHADYKPMGVFYKLIFVPNGVYKGMFGPNGYDDIMILGYDGEGWYVVSKFGDKFDIYETGPGFNVDIPSNLGVPVIWFNKPILIDNRLDISSVVGEVVDKGYKL